MTRLGVHGVTEKPYVYIFGRSHSSIKDQVLYSPLRIEDFEKLQPVTASNGDQYQAIQRLGIGEQFSYVMLCHYNISY